MVQMLGLDARPSSSMRITALRVDLSIAVLIFSFPPVGMADLELLMRFKNTCWSCRLSPTTRGRSPASERTQLDPVHIQGVSDHLDDVLKHPFSIRILRASLSEAGEAQEIFHHLFAVKALPFNGLQVIIGLRILIRFPEQKIAEAENHPKRIVDLMGHARGQGPQEASFSALTSCLSRFLFSVMSRAMQSTAFTPPSSFFRGMKLR